MTLARLQEIWTYVRPAPLLGSRLLGVLALRLVPCLLGLAFLSVAYFSNVPPDLIVTDSGVTRYVVAAYGILLWLIALDPHRSVLHQYGAALGALVTISRMWGFFALDPFGDRTDLIGAVAERFATIFLVFTYHLLMVVVIAARNGGHNLLEAAE